MAVADQAVSSCDPAPAVAGDLAYRATTEDGIDEVAALALWQHAATARVFNHPAWWAAAIHAFGAGRRLRVIRIRQGEATVALWPLWLKRLGPKELLTRILEPVGARVTDYCLPLLHRHHDGARLTDLLLREAARGLDAQTLLLWPKLPLDGNHGVDVADLAGALGLLCATTDHPCPAMALPACYGDLERSWGKSHRGDVRRQIRRLGRAGRLELVTARTRAELAAGLPRLYAMHTANWRARSGSADLGAGPMTEFVAALAATLPLQLLEVSEVHLDGVAISCHFGFREPDRLLWYKPTFDVTWSNYAPGKVHVALAAQRSIEEGLRRFDFMQGNEPYKMLWTDLTTETKTFALARPMAYPMWAWNARLRNFAAEYRL